MPIDTLAIAQRLKETEAGGTLPEAAAKAILEPTPTTRRSRGCPLTPSSATAEMHRGFFTLALWTLGVVVSTVGMTLGGMYWLLLNVHPR